jgi:uncharacterized protein
MYKAIVPVVPQKRIISIDILRGIALFGILLVNVLGFNASFFDFGGFYNNLSDPSQQSFYNIYISLTADKFIFLFSFLFGYGINMQLNKFKGKSKEFNYFFIRRMLLLAVFGILHIVFLWAGDILFLYAITGFVILLIYKLKNSGLVIISMLFYFFIAIWLLFSVWFSLPDAMSSTCTDCLETALNTYPAGNYFDCLKLRLDEYLAFLNINAFYYLPKVIGIVIMGFLASKIDLFKRVVNNRKAWLVIFVLLTLLSTLVYFNFENMVNFDSQFANAVYMLGYEVMNIFVASTYILAVVLISSIGIIAKILKPIANTGRMSLTNYLMQSVILSVIFYGWGFGLFGHQKVTDLVLIAICVYLFQMVYSSIWLKYFDQGPLEALWRKFSYKKSKRVKIKLKSYKNMKSKLFFHFSTSPTPEVKKIF